MKKLFIIPIIFILSIMVVSAVPQYALGDYIFRNVYGIYNATTVQAQKFFGDGSGLTNISANDNVARSRIDVLNATKLENGSDATLNNVYINELRFNTSVTPTLSEGECAWDSDNDALSCGYPLGTTLQVGQELYWIVTNLDNQTLPEGTAVSVQGVSGNREGIVRTDISNHDSAHNFIGLITSANCTVNQKCAVTTFGKVRNINTNNFTEGVDLYVGSVPGSLSNNVPTEPNYIVKVGIVTVKNINNGIISLNKVVIPTLNELSDVDGVPLSTSGQFLVWNQSTNTWSASSNINNYLLNSDQRYNDTALINNVNTTLSSSISNVSNSLSNYALLASNNTFTGKNLYYGDSWFYGDINIINKSINQFQLSNGSSGLVLKDISNTTVGSWLDVNGTANLYTNGDVNAKTLSITQGNLYTAIGATAATKGGLHINPNGTNNIITSITFGGNNGGSLLNYPVAGIYSQSSSVYGSRLLFATTPSFGTITEDMRIDENGNVIIGTTTSANSRLQSYGSSNDAQFMAYFSSANNTNAISYFRNDGYIQLKSSPLTVSIQSTSDAPLQVYGLDTWSGISFTDSSSSDVLYYSGQHRTFSFGGSGSNVAGKKLAVYGGMSIGNSSTYYTGTPPANGLIVEGNVGIGKTNPTNKFEVAYPSGAEFYVEDYSGYTLLNGNGGWIFLRGTQVAGSFIPDGDNTRPFGDSTRRFSKLYTKMITDTGVVVGIGTLTPSQTLTVNGTIATYASDNSSQLMCLNITQAGIVGAYKC